VEIVAGYAFHESAPDDNKKPLSLKSFRRRPFDFGHYYTSTVIFIHPQFFILDSIHLPVECIAVDQDEAG
jgi:hypothetical protein